MGPRVLLALSTFFSGPHSSSLGKSCLIVGPGKEGFFLRAYCRPCSKDETDGRSDGRTDVADLLNGAKCQVFPASLVVLHGDVEYATPSYLKTRQSLGVLELQPCTDHLLKNVGKARPSNARHGCHWLTQHNATSKGSDGIHFDRCSRSWHQIAEAGIRKHITSHPHTHIQVEHAEGLTDAQTHRHTGITK